MKCIRIEPFLFYSNTHICISLDVFVGHFKMRRICVNIFNATLFVFNKKHKIRMQIYVMIKNLCYDPKLQLIQDGFSDTQFQQQHQSRLGDQPWHYRPTICFSSHNFSTLQKVRNHIFWHGYINKHTYRPPRGPISDISCDCCGINIDEY